MNRYVELPLVEPIYSTYHKQGSGAAVIASNPSIRNWYLNEVMDLSCNRLFLSGYTTPRLEILKSTWKDNPHLKRNWNSMRFIKGHVHSMIREMLDNGYYVYFRQIDDYYIEGKTWYKQRHFPHDGLICGYNRDDDTYCIFAYDNNWVYRKFWITKKSFEKGRASSHKMGTYGAAHGIKAREEEVFFQPQVAISEIAHYINSNLDMFPVNGEGNVRGIVVHEYLNMYIEKLKDESIPYERMDYRIFRLIWEHKKVMLERIEKIEEALELGNQVSEKYKKVVAEADMIRMLYASHHIKRRDSVLPTIIKINRDIKETEESLLKELISRTKEVCKDETVGVY